VTDTPEPRRDDYTVAFTPQLSSPRCHRAARFRGVNYSQTSRLQVASAYYFRDGNARADSRWHTSEIAPQRTSIRLQVQIGQFIVTKHFNHERGMGALLCRCPLRFAFNAIAEGRPRRKHRHPSHRPDRVTHVARSMADGEYRSASWFR